MNNTAYNKLEYDKFRNNIKEIIVEEVDNFLQKKNLYETHSGVVIDVNTNSDNPYEQICNVDLVFTKLSNLLNKRGQKLQSGDSVLVFTKIGSHYSNCFIAFKNA